MDKQLEQKIKIYLAAEDEYFFRDELEKVIDRGDLDELHDRFYRDLEFGTAGLRGVIAAGFNRINSFVIKKTGQGVAQYMLKEFQKPHAVIAYDCRHHSKNFAELTAQVLASNGIKVSFFNDLRPTPALAFATVRLQAHIGIMITASHNPSDYNGYKVFQSDGSQIIAPTDRAILDEIEQSRSTKLLAIGELEKQNLISYIGTDLDHAYFSMAKKCIIQPELYRNAERLKVIYSPLHGTGKAYIEALFNDLGVNYITVPEQADPDGNFPTIAYPNPEETEGMAMALALAKKENANLVIANDPDSDRMAVAYADEDGKLICLNGNQMGVLLSDYLLMAHHLKGGDLSTSYIVKSIVTGELERYVTEGYGATCFNVLTGFKWIADKIREQEKTAIGNFIFGNEEAIGYLVHQVTRDKDGITAALTAIEMALYHQGKGKNLGERLEEIYYKYGYYEEKQISKSYTGELGVTVMKNLMHNLRHQDLKKIGNLEIISIYDFLTGEIRNLNGKASSTMSYALSDVLQFNMSNGSRLSVRPSGTEPKIKFYISSVVSNYQIKSDRMKATAFYNDVNSFIEQLIN